MNEFLSNDDRGRIRDWWKQLCLLRRDPSIQGPAPLQICFAEDHLLAFSRGQNGDFFMLNFGGWSGYKYLGVLNLPVGVYHELWNSTWPAFEI